MDAGVSIISVCFITFFIFDVRAHPSIQRTRFFCGINPHCRVPGFASMWRTSSVVKHGDTMPAKTKRPTQEEMKTRIARLKDLKSTKAMA